MKSRIVPADFICVLVNIEDFKPQLCCEGENQPLSWSALIFILATDVCDTRGWW